MPGRIIGRKPITKEVLEELIRSGIPEGDTLDYKRAINLEKPQARIELCADAASFANASGGDIIFGMDEDGNAKAKELVALSDFARDSTERQLRQIFNAHVDPPIPGLSFEEVELSPGAFVLVLRIPRSWNRPHTVLGNPPSFPRRDGSHKRNMKVRELREAFGLSESIAERMKQFRAERIAALVAGNVPTALEANALVVVHLLPVRAFDGPLLLDVRDVITKDALLWPIQGRGVTKKINFDGVLTYSPSFGPSESYVQVFRNGCVEAVNATILPREAEGMIFSTSYEPLVESGLRKYLSFLLGEGVEPPIFIAISLLNARGYDFRIPDRFGEYETPQSGIDRDVLIIPETRIDSYADTYYDVLKEPFDRIWQATGRIGSINYTDGKWNRKEGI